MEGHVWRSWVSLPALVSLTCDCFHSVWICSPVFLNKGDRNLTVLHLAFEQTAAGRTEPCHFTFPGTLVHPGDTLCSATSQLPGAGRTG